MKVLHLIQKNQLRGAEVFTCQLAKLQQREGHDVKVVALFAGEADLPFKTKSLGRPSNRRFVDYFGWKQLAEIIEEFQPDIVQANAGDTLKYAVFSRKLFRWKVPIIARNASTVSLYIKSTHQRWLNNILYRAVDYVISVSEASKKDLNKIFSATQAKSCTIPIGVDISKKASVVEGFEKDHFNIVHVGGFSFEKNHKMLVEAFAELHRQYSSIRLHLIGDGILKNNILQMAIELGLQKVVSFHGYRNNAVDYIHSADLLVLPSVIEGLPGVILEAQYYKTPVLATDVGGVSEIIAHGTTGWMIEPDIQQLVGGILKVLEMDAASKENVVKNAHEQVIQHYNNEVIAKKFLQVYRQVLKR